MTMDELIFKIFTTLMAVIMPIATVFFVWSLLKIDKPEYAVFFGVTCLIYSAIFIFIFNYTVLEGWTS